MTEQEARLRLSVCRWAKEDRDDPYFAAALDRAAKEPALAEWWAEQREMDALLSGKMCELPVPAALAEALAHHRPTAP